MDEARHAGAARSIKQRVRSLHVGANKIAGVGDAAIHMTLGSKVNHAVHPLAEQRLDSPRITDVAPVKPVVGVGLDFRQVLEIPRVGQLVKIDDRVVGMRAQNKPNEIGTNESGTAGDQKLHCP